LRPYVEANPQVKFVLIHFSERYQDNQLREYFATAGSDGCQPRNVVLWLDSGIVDFSVSDYVVQDRANAAVEKALNKSMEDEKPKHMKPEKDKPEKASVKTAKAPTANASAAAAVEPAPQDIDMEAFLWDHPYIGGFAPSAKDHDLYSKLVLSSGRPTTTAFGRWYDHIESFSEWQRTTWP